MEKASKNFLTELKKQKRENKSLLFLDNVKIVKDALAEKSVNPLYLLTSLKESEFLALNFAINKSVKIFKVDQKTIEQLSDTKTPQKILCVAKQNEFETKIPTQNFLVLDGLQDPGNIGTLIRTAKACGFECVFLLDCVRKCNEKLIRSSVGTVLSSNIFEMKKDDFVQFAKSNKLKLVCCDMDGENVFKFQPSSNVGVVVGNEGQGVSQEIENLCYKKVKIPMKEGIESLNAGVSGSIVMYQLSKDNLE